MSFETASAEISALPQHDDAKEHGRVFLLRVPGRLEAEILEFGGILRALRVPSQHGGALLDVVLGMETPSDYANTSNPPYLGCIVGRYANRITRGKFTIDGVQYQLAVNNGPNSLHGGIKGFDKVLWKGTVVENEKVLKLSYVSADGEEGYPGILSVEVVYSIVSSKENDKAGLKIEYHAEVKDKPTIVSLTNHSYFNLAGHDSGVSVLETELFINAEQVTETDEDMTTTGKVLDVKGGPLDFYSEKKLIGKDIADLPQFLNGGYDHNYVLKEGDRSNLKLAARAASSKTGIILETYTDAPGVQIYTGNWLDGSFSGKNGVTYPKHSGFCLETQWFPDSINQPHFPSVILRPGEKLRTQTIYTFQYD